ncbi:MAG: PASTA domain-containing protein [Ruminococcaceae bacterium]|nr:PASTA domain-containing protein [Oscillospiraceae bacterium]
MPKPEAKHTRKQPDASKPSKTAVSVRMRNSMIFVAVFLILIGFGASIYHLVIYQVIESESYRSRAEDQQLLDSAIKPNRGTIYDANMSVLASSTSVYNLIVSPYDMYKAGTNVNMVATKFSELFGLSVETLIEQFLQTENKYIKVKSKLDKPVVDEIQTWMSDYNATEAAKTSPIAGITFENDTKRAYPYGSFASNVLGFIGSDGNGIVGLELKYNDILTGTNGRVVSARNANGGKVNGDYEAVYEAQDGNSLVLTIDENIQNSLEKYLGNAVTEHNVANRGFGIVMNVNTGAILGMATLPTFDLNDPFTLYDQTLADTISAIEDEATRTETRRTAQQSMWRNKAVSDVYEPGSVFKVVTASAALDSGKASLDTSFGCSGKIAVADHTMRCAKDEGHGTLNFFGGLNESCNPYFIQLAWQLGADTFCDYLQAFGFYEKTGIDMNNEAKSVVYARDKMNITELSSSAFGQSSTVTGIQMITAVAAAVNGGYLVEPYTVQQIIDSNGNIIENHETVVKRQVISEETSATMASLLERTVDKSKEATAHNSAAYVAGYRVGGKSGTSQKQSVIVGNEDDHLRIASFCGFAPADDPEVAVLIVLDEPNSPLNTSYGGRLCGPVVGSVIADIMPYLNIDPEYSEEDLANMSVTVPTLTGENNTLSAAQVSLNSLGLNYRIVGNGATVTYQYPASGTSLERQSTVVLYTEEGSEGTVVTVPDVSGKSITLAQEMLKGVTLNMSADGVTTDGTGVQAVEQSIAPGTEVPMGTVVTVTFHDVAATD